MTDDKLIKSLELRIRQLVNELAQVKGELAAMRKKYGPCDGRAVLAMLYRKVPARLTGTGVAHDVIDCLLLDDSREQVYGRNYLMRVKEDLESAWRKRAVRYTEDDGETTGAAVRHDQFRSAENARKAYKAWCATRDCAECPYQHSRDKVATTCFDRWLYGTDADVKGE